jgi:cellulose synthase/poly-beta-1,6-N-acetylglucosamine synthase-like glycosyltransferase
MAFNEEANIGKLLQSLLNQRLDKAILQDIIVVSSGSTDQTNVIVREWSARDPRIRLIIQTKREGKSSAINLWLKEKNAPLLILESADTLPNEDTVEKLLLPFQDSQVGMTGAHPAPINNPRTFMGFAVNLEWRLHHLMALQNPKMGEMVAFRNILPQISATSAVDEADIEKEIKKQNLKVVYVPEAVVQNKGPENVADFLKQRRRIFAGHLALQKNNHYEVATMSGLKIFGLLIKNMDLNWHSLCFTPFVILLEVYGRFLGWYDFKTKGQEPTIWDIAESTKNLN